ncbi:hypothetical protein C9F11_37850 [Streptomyces sp. YIM 121038]|uniref:hypothetical protein n=1 Tax=Streptomyces sp. YIM 121038 TaxID=2136401 RepID=UPI0011107F14|nr:hypothetical protein [Streptomyces sp. YIM 121038]QCX81153.1 hypothetical protein C9F11_37850 [Streptomyces sp. YIM 121038]
MPTRSGPSAPQLESFYNLGLAAVLLGLKTKDEHENGSKKGERWLRDGVNRLEDGSEGRPFPHHRMNGCLMFSESNLAEIAEMHLNAPTQGPRRRTRRKKTAPSQATPLTEGAKRRRGSEMPSAA